QALDLAQLVRGRVTHHADADDHLLERGLGRVRDHVTAYVEVAARDRLEAVVVHPELGGVEGEYRGIAADRAGKQELERRRRAMLPAHMHGLADDEFVTALLAVDELVERSDGGHLDLDEALRPPGRRFVRIGAVAALARVGDRLELGKAVADFGHSVTPKSEIRHTHHNRLDASCAPSASEASFIHTILESTCRRPAKVPKPQSTPAMTFSRPTTPAYCTMRSATSSGCSTKFEVESITPGMMILPSGSFTSFHTFHSCPCRGLAPGNDTACGRPLSTMSTMS